MKAIATICVALLAYTFALPEPHFQARNINEFNQSSRIFGGSAAGRREVPYQISLQLNKGTGFSHICGGAILSETGIITAGHCILINDPSRYVVIAGLLNLGEYHPDVQIVPVAVIAVHPGYPGGIAANDLALVTLGEPLLWTDAVKPIALPPHNKYPEGYSKLSGWGLVNSIPPITPVTLQQVTVPVIGLDECKQLLDERLPNHILDESMVCTGPLTGRESACNGDSGGPLAQGNILIGIVSWGINPCGQIGSPSVYTNIAVHFGFFRQYLPDNYNY